MSQLGPDVVREAHGWHTQCSACGYGATGWAWLPARHGKPVIGTSSMSCPGCGRVFTHSRNVAFGEASLPLNAPEPTT